MKSLAIAAAIAVMAVMASGAMRAAEAGAADDLLDAAKSDTPDAIAMIDRAP